MSQELVCSVSIDALLLKRDGIVERLRLAHEALGEADTLAEALFGEEHRGHRLALVTASRRREFTTPDGLDELIKEVDGRAWAYLLRESGLQTFMDAAARDKWNDAIHKNDVPPLTRETIEATFTALYDARGEMFERGVVAVFRGLSWDYKTNNPRMFGKRLVLRHVVSTYGPVFDGANRLDDLVRVFSVLEGKLEPDHRQGMYRQLSEARRAGQPLRGEYFSLRTFGNGNGHLTFTRPELVDKLNAILAKHYPNALPVARPTTQR